MRRTHPVAVAGEINSYGFDRKNNVFTLRYTAEKKGETLIFVHKPFETQTKYKVIEQYDNGASLIGITANKGEHTETIKIKD